METQFRRCDEREVRVEDLFFGIGSACKDRWVGGRDYLRLHDYPYDFLVSHPASRMRLFHTTCITLLVVTTPSLASLTNPTAKSFTS
jgi:hypothetical protein